MKKLEGEAVAVRTCAVVGDRATTTFTIAADKDAPSYQFEGVVLDFAGVSREELIALAEYNIRVKRIQAAWRKASRADQFAPQKWERTWGVREMLDSPRTRAEVDPATAAVRALVRGGLSEADAVRAVERLLRVKPEAPR